MSNDIDLADAYALQTPDDNRDLYSRWANTYESGFITDNGYVYHLGVAQVFLGRSTYNDGPILDVGCGTGLVGEALRTDSSCPGPLDGLDISPEMLKKALEKRTVEGESVYSELHVGDLTAILELADEAYGGITSCGTFTHGHVGPGALDELYRIARPGALFAIGVNPDHYVTHGFADRFADDAVAGTITEPAVHLVPTYESGPNVGVLSPVIVFRRQ
tara:strand:+ start:1504 stop:2157 length:654 start_codon:yes stop_codon:yes gene_type:complete